jgi:hypothetical protein
MPDIHQYLDLATARLPPELAIAGLDTAPGVIAHPTCYGWWLWVPDDPEDSARATDEPIPGVVLAIQRYARGLDCNYVLFDADGDRDSNLPTWDW